MAHVRAVGLLALLSAVPAVTESVTIELTPQGMVWLWLHAPDRAMAESLGTALGRSLGCTLTGVTESPSGGEWVFHAHCPAAPDAFERRGQEVAADGSARAVVRLPACPGVGNDGDLPGGGGAVGRNVRSPRWRHRSCGSRIACGMALVGRAERSWRATSICARSDFALVWTANFLWDLFGHRFAATVETVAA